MAVLFPVLLLLCLQSSTLGNLMVERQVTTEATHKDVLDRWKELDKNSRSSVDSLVQQILPILIRSNSELELTPECSGSILKMVLGLRQMNWWSLLMIDASGKIPSGVFSGTTTALGNYDQCVNLTVFDESGYTNPPKKQFQGQYCTIEFRTPLPRRPRFYRINELLKPLDQFNSTNYMLRESAKIIQFAYFLAYRIGVCVPSTCSQEDVKMIIENMALKSGMRGDVPRCEIKNEWTINKGQLVILSLMGFFLLMMGIGTFVDVLTRWRSKGEEQPKTVLRGIVAAFSLESNLRRLLNTDNVSADSIPALHGMRFLSMTWVILGHTYLFEPLQILRNFEQVRIFVRSFHFQTIINGLVAVDSFFFISGFLVCYLTVKFVDSKGRQALNIPVIILRRILRLLPSTMLVIGLTMLIPFFGSGPVWHETTDFLWQNCQKNWWANLLFFNNYLRGSDMCLPHTWYTASDMQLFIVAMVFFVLLFRKKSLGFGFLIFMVIFSVISTSAINYWKDLPPTMLLANPDPQDMLELWGFTHFPPHTHLGAYCVGLALGVILARAKPGAQIPRTKLIIGWIVNAIGNLSIMYSTYEWNRDSKPSVVVSTIYSGTHRTGWALGLGWVTYVCALGYGGWVNSILSWKGLIPLSRLTFLAYLWHFLVIYLYVGNLRGTIDAHHFMLVWTFIGHLFGTFCLALMSYVVFDAPLSQLERLMFRGKGQDKKQASVGDAKVESGVDMRKMSGDSLSVKHRNGQTTHDVNGVNGVNGTYVYKM